VRKNRDGYFGITNQNSEKFNLKITNQNQSYEYASTQDHEIYYES